MKPLTHHLAGRLLLGDLLSASLSACVLAWRGQVDTGHAAAPINAVSHWLWPRRALHENHPSARFTLTGLAVHFAAASLWCGLYEWLRSRRPRITAASAVGDALAVGAVSAAVDLACVPDRLTPGFEQRLSTRSLVMVYGAFAAGLALAGLAHGAGPETPTKETPMLQKDQRHKQHRRNSGDAQDPQDKLPSYQDLLDEALDDTFPASDPPATTAATRVHEPHATPRDSHDWTLQPERAEGCGAAQERAARVAATLTAPLQLGGLTVPAGPCGLQQTDHSAVLSWQENGQARHTDLDLEALRVLLADGRLQRHTAP